MTVAELNDLPYIGTNIDRLMRIVEQKAAPPKWFLVDDDLPLSEFADLKRLCRGELESLMAEYRRRASYIERIMDPWMQRILTLRFIERKSFRELGTQEGITSGTIKQEVYSYLRLHPEGYISSRELADQWKVNVNTINAYCRRGQLPGAKKWGQKRLWLIPDDAERPVYIPTYKRQKIPRGFTTAKDLAESLGMTPGYISNKCKRGEFPGARQIERRMWIIPAHYKRSSKMKKQL